MMSTWRGDKLVVNTFLDLITKIINHRTYFWIIIFRRREWYGWIGIYKSDDYRVCIWYIYQLQSDQITKPDIPWKLNHQFPSWQNLWYMILVYILHNTCSRQYAKHTWYYAWRRKVNAIIYCIICYKLCILNCIDDEEKNIMDTREI